MTASTNVIRDFTYVEDVSNVIIAALFSVSAENTPEIYNVAGGMPYTLAQLIEIINQLQIPLEIEIHSQDPLDVKMTHGSIEKLRASGLPIPLTRLHEGIAATWNWMNHIENDQLRAWFEYSL